MELEQFAAWLEEKMTKAIHDMKTTSGTDFQEAIDDFEKTRAALIMLGKYRHDTNAY